MKKRNDLQWLRALAVVSVVGFHLYPKTLIYGYLGVDIFFVLSGFLMTSILSKNNNLLQFYCNRIKRILPTFSFVIALVFVIGYFTFLSSDYKFFKTEAIWSIFFVNNMYPFFHKKQYFELVAEYKFLLHTWSLGVELQFYLLAPFLLQFLLRKSISWTFILTLLSFLLQQLIFDDSISFGFVFCRIWQFLFGTLAFVVVDRNFFEYREVSTTTKIFLNLLFVCLFATCFNGFSCTYQKIYATILRVISVTFTSIFIALNTLQPLNLPFVINVIFVYIGDLSYVIYLVHWPIIALVKYFELTLNDSLIILIILGTAVPIYQCFEMFLKKFQTKTIFCLILMFYCIILMFCCINNVSREMKLNPIMENEKLAESCRKLYYDKCEPDPMLEEFVKIKSMFTFPIKYCSYKLNNSAQKSALIIGNSYAYFHNRVLVEALNESKTEFKKVYFITLPGCTFIVGKFNQKYICKGYYDALNNFLSAIKPDLVINTAKIQLFIPHNISATNIAEDEEYYLEFKKNILNVAKYTLRLILIQPNPYFPGKKAIQSPLTVAQILRKNGTTSHFNVTTEMFHKYHNPSWARVKKVTTNCSNCLIVPTEHLFCQDGICHMVNQETQISMYCDNNHITSEKSLSFKPGLLKAIDANLIDLKNKK